MTHLTHLIIRYFKTEFVLKKPSVVHCKGLISFDHTAGRWLHHWTCFIKVEHILIWRMKINASVMWFVPLGNTFPLLRWKPSSYQPRGQYCTSRKGRLNEGSVLFKDTFNTFIYGYMVLDHLVKDHSDTERGNLLLPHGLLFLISSQGSFICTIPDRITHTTAVVIPVVEHWLEQLNEGILKESPAQNKT